jgi:hypothetical protein
MTIYLNMFSLHDVGKLLVNCEKVLVICESDFSLNVVLVSGDVVDTILSSILNIYEIDFSIKKKILVTS